MSLKAEDIIRRIIEEKDTKGNGKSQNPDVVRGENEYKLYESKRYERSDNYYFDMEVLERINKGDSHQWYVHITKTDETYGRQEDIMVPIGMLKKMLPDLMQAIYVFGSADQKDRKTHMKRIKNRPERYSYIFPDNDGERARIEAKFMQFMLDCKP